MGHQAQDPFMRAQVNYPNSHRNVIRPHNKKHVFDSFSPHKLEPDFETAQIEPPVDKGDVIHSRNRYQNNNALDYDAFLAVITSERFPI